MTSTGLAEKRSPATSGPEAVDPGRQLDLSYVVPVRLDDEEGLGELAGYLDDLGRRVSDVIVVDGSSPQAVAAHRAELGPAVRVVRPDAVTPMGKVGGVLTGLRHARHERVVIADDDVRYEVGELREVTDRLVDADVVRPQNYFDRLPWHARVDSSRTTLNRVLGGDWPGTLAVRRSTVLDAGGYAGDVMFENLELVRTVVAAGGRHRLALDVLVARRPPTTSHFRRQQVRQAYDELARPWRLVPTLAVAPTVTLLARRKRWRPLIVAGVTVVGLAELGRRRSGGARCYPWSSSLLAPLWLVWRSLCTFVAVGAWLRGGVRYRGVRLRRAATSARQLREQQRAGVVRGVVGDARPKPPMASRATTEVSRGAFGAVAASDGAGARDAVRKPTLLARRGQNRRR